MAQPKLREEWNQLSLLIISSPFTISEYRAKKQANGALAQELLKKPAFKLLADGVKVENTYITLPEVAGHKFNVRIYRPNRSTTDTLPVALFFHGGYWVSGDANGEDFGERAIIARGNDIIIVSFHYRLIPDVDWQTQFSDAEYAMKWLAFNAPSIGGEVSKGFLVGGTEAGAHLAAITAIRARNRYPNIKLTGQYLIVPTTIAWPDPHIPEAWRSFLTSHEENVTAPVLSEESYEMFLSALGVPDDEKRKGENFPMWGPLENLPPAYLPMDECDPIRDQGFLYTKLLRDAGVLTRTEYYKGLPNIFVQFPELPATLVARGNLAAGVAWLLSEKK